ncbi:MAG: hypothetical protein KAV82_06815 [Phycisphaerae bacterium]|nr:hypothetical protein [Phycisphaerae bacterium]
MRHSRNTFFELVEAVLRDIPAPFVQYLDGVMIEVEPLPDRRACRDGRVDDPRGNRGTGDSHPFFDSLCGGWPGQVDGWHGQASEARGDC